MRNILKNMALAAILLPALSSCADDFPTVLNMNRYVDPDEGKDTVTVTPAVPDSAFVTGTFNLWISNKGTGEYVWTNRRAYLAQSIVKNKFEIFGIEEANPTIQNELPTLVRNAGGKNYEWWFVGRDTQDGTGGEALGIVYDTTRFKLSDKHFFWLSETPDVMSYGWDELSYHRIAACALVVDKKTDTEFFMMVTHGPLGDVANSRCGDVLIDREKMYNTYGAPSILVGDMNCDETSTLYSRLSSYYKDVYKTLDASAMSGTVGTFNGQGNSNLSKVSSRIDYVFYRGAAIRPFTYKVDTYMYEGKLYPSDHCPVIVSMIASYETPKPDLLKGSGTEADPYQIDTPAHWNKMAESVNGTSTDTYSADQYYKLTADLDFTGKDFITLGYAADGSKTFNGSLDGGGHSVKGIKVIAPAGSFGGLVGNNKGTIKNIYVESDISTAFKYVGGVVGENNGTIDGVTVKCSITGTTDASCLGGIAGRNYGIIVNCGDLGSVLSAKSATKSENMGGIVGQTAGASYIINCYSWVKTLSSSNNNIGGVIGIVSDDSFVINCYSTISSIDASSSFAPVVGYSKKGNVRNIYGNIACASANTTGSAIGNDKSAGTVWKTSALLLTLDGMKSGAVTMPSTGKSCADFVAALNAGVDEFNAFSKTDMPSKPEVKLKSWTKSDTYPICK